MKENPQQIKARIRRIFEEIGAPSKYAPILPSSELEMKRERELEHKRLIENDNARRRNMNRVLLLSLHMERERFVFDSDPGEDKDVAAYLTDTRVTGLFDHTPLYGRAQRKEHNRILLEDDQGNIAAIEFFGISQGIDLRGLSEQATAAKTLLKVAPQIPVTLDPQRKRK